MSAVAMHPEPGVAAEEVRWLVPEGAVPGPGTALEAPGDLGALLADGTLSEVRLLGGCVVTRARTAETWRRSGDRVRRAVGAALADPGGWRIERSPADDSALAAAARRLVAGEVGTYVRSHGGSIDLVGVADGVVTVRLRGACHGCPAAAYTLRNQVERRLRDECPELVALVAA